MLRHATQDSENGRLRIATRDVVNTVKNIRVPLKGGEFLE
jgi:hypothetical protein